MNQFSYLRQAYLIKLNQSTLINWDKKNLSSGSYGAMYSDSMWSNHEIERRSLIIYERAHVQIQVTMDLRPRCVF